MFQKEDTSLLFNKIKELDNIDQNNTKEILKQLQVPKSISRLFQ